MGLDFYLAEERDKVVIMFSAHSLPMKVVNKGDPYVKEVFTSADLVMQKLGKNNTHLVAWQSKGLARLYPVESFCIGSNHF